MDSVRRQLRPFSGIALLAIAALVLVPIVSRALAWAAGESAWVEVCTPRGSEVVELDTGDGAGQLPPIPADHLDRCPLCAPGVNLMALPPAVAVAASPATAASALRALVLHAPRALFAWGGAQPRAPPIPT